MRRNGEIDREKRKKSEEEGERVRDGKSGSWPYDHQESLDDPASKKIRNVSLLSRVHSNLISFH